MSNPSKNKGDRAEREYLAYFAREHAEHMRDDAMRHLGAGRRDDVGDVRLMHGVATQVKHYANPSTAILHAVDGARRQRENARDSLGVGIVKIPRARAPRPVWLACAYLEDFPQLRAGELEEIGEVFRISGRMLTWLASADEPKTIAQARAAATTKAQLRALGPAPCSDLLQRIALWHIGGRIIAVAPEPAWVLRAAAHLARGDEALGLAQDASVSAPTGLVA
ncbi:hypothetical protein Bequi_13550 [Brachybacterium sp. JHP9]|uniref:Uncharacterized protein n=1 Tax=Brachybacterium equifaecis TaxID=2910770 RepID=A0ABT0R652_9MICO|nr:hypothetical protein [Brachybacterium equifaecis]MCL6424390.1 hypothetical protein [Brachybacterium equifaecis]